MPHFPSVESFFFLDDRQYDEYRNLIVEDFLPIYFILLLLFTWL